MTNESTEIRVMPEGAIYWYGWNYAGVAPDFEIGYSSGTPRMGGNIYTNSIYLYLSNPDGTNFSWGGYHWRGHEMRNLSAYTKLKICMRTSIPSGFGASLYVANTTLYGVGISASSGIHIGSTDITTPIEYFDHVALSGQTGQYHDTSYYALWLE